MDIDLIVILVVLIFLCAQKNSSTEGFSIFKKGEIDEKVNILMEEEYKNLFKPDGVYADAATRSKLCWLDPVMYYDLAKLHYSNSYTRQNVRNLFEQ